MKMTDPERIAQLEANLEVARTERNVALERVEEMRARATSAHDESGDLIREGSWFAGEDAELARQRAAGQAIGARWAVWHRLGSEEIAVTTTKDCEQLIVLLEKVLERIDDATGCESPTCILPRGHEGGHAGGGEAPCGGVVEIQAGPFVGNAPVVTGGRGGKP